MCSLVFGGGAGVGARALPAHAAAAASGASAAPGQRRVKASGWEAAFSLELETELSPFPENSACSKDLTFSAPLPAEKEEELQLLLQHRV